MVTVVGEHGGWTGSIKCPPLCRCLYTISRKWPFLKPLLDETIYDIVFF